MNEQDKDVHFYSLHDFIEKEELSEPLYKYKNWKKLTSIQKVSQKIFDKDMEGIIIGDKVGEIYFLNMANLDKLPKYAEVEGAATIKQENEENVVKLLYGMQQTVTGVGLSSCNRYMLSFDTLNKVVVNNFPNVFEIQTVNTNHQEEIKAYCQVQDCLVTVSQDAERCRVIKQNIQDGSFLYEQVETSSVTDKKVEQVFYSAEDDKVILVSKNSAGKYEVDEVQEGKGLASWQSGFDAANFNGYYVAQDCLGKSRYVLQANYDATNGCLEAKDSIELLKRL